MTSDTFNLSWNYFEASASNSYKELLSEGSFSDVTLVSDDEKQIQAHKFILSTSSSVFKRMLAQNAHKNTLIFMTGLKSQDLMSIINFMYTGETEVAQDNLGHFMEIAAKFKVKGLTEGNQYDFKRVTRSHGVIETQEQDCTQQFISKTNISEEDSHIANHVMESVIIHESKEVNLNISNNLQSNLFNDWNQAH